jgi:two-component system chemotaxis response regulator CheY
VILDPGQYCVKASILVVDDTPAILMVVQGFLEPEGYRITTVRNGKAALRELEAGAFDLVLTDILMPDMEGLELIRRIKKNFPTLPVIAMSGGGQYMEGDRTLGMARSLGAHAILSKPFKGEALLKCISAALAGAS